MLSSTAWQISSGLLRLRTNGRRADLKPAISNVTSSSRNSFWVGPFRVHGPTELRQFENFCQVGADKPSKTLIESLGYAMRRDGMFEYVVDGFALALLRAMDYDSRETMVCSIADRMKPLGNREIAVRYFEASKGVAFSFGSEHFPFMSYSAVSTFR